MARKASQDWRDNGLKIWDQRMLLLMESKTSGDRSISRQEFFDSIGFNQSNISQIYAKKQSFKHEHFASAGELYNISMDWFYGFTNSKDRKEKKVTVEDLLKEALQMLKSKRHSLR